MSEDEPGSTSGPEPQRQVVYSEAAFRTRSIAIAAVAAALTLWLASATGWKAWTVAAFAGTLALLASMMQATLIENAVVLAIVAALLWVASATAHFDFHWSVLLAAAIGALHGVAGREGAAREAFRREYGEEEYRKRYGGGDETVS